MRTSELLSTLRGELYTAVVGDVMDAAGFRRQFLPAAIRPMIPEMKIAGLAMPVLQADVFDVPREPFGLMTQALDHLKPEEVYVATGGSMRSANWGEIMTAAAKARGAAGAVINGFHRDTTQVLAQKWPVFSHGAWAQDSAPRMKVLDFACRIEIGAATVRPGDLIFADLDGVAVIPAEAADEIVAAALTKARAEKKVRQAIEQGMSATDAFAKYGVL